MGLNPDPLERTIFTIFLYILMILLVVLVVWGLTFLYQQQSFPNVIFLGLTCLYQYESIPIVADLLKFFDAQIPCFLSKFETRFYSYSCRSRALQAR